MNSPMVFVLVLLVAVNVNGGGVVVLKQLGRMSLEIFKILFKNLGFIS
jgi:hypothetical protein